MARRQNVRNAMIRVAAIAVTATGSAFAQVVTEPVPNAAQALALQRAIEAYWTVERMASAIPLDMFVTSSVASRAAAPRARQLTSSLVPGFGPGATPEMARRGATLAAPVSLPEFAGIAAPTTFGVVPTNPYDGFTGPFQRFAQAGRYLTYPISTVGKLFVTLPVGNVSCSATAINRSTIVTAGHCNSDGFGTLATNRMFCPSYVPTGPNPASGCWAGVTSAVSGAWHTQGDLDYDYACVVTATTGTVHANKMGNVTGWAGRAWNLNDMLEVAMGYASGSVFSGGHIQVNAAPHWYDYDNVPGGQVSKYHGNDLFGAAAGGPWIVGYANGSSGAEAPDVDGRAATDPGFFAVNGLNSHKGCKGPCVYPPPSDNSMGVFWNEVGSPPFRSNAADPQDSEDVFAVCFAHVNNNP